MLALMAEGRSNQAIAVQLFMSPKTVETHVGSLFAKLTLPPAATDHRRVLAVAGVPEPLSSRCNPLNGQPYCEVDDGGKT